MRKPVRSKSIVSLFSGIGGFELGLSKAGFKPVLFCEIDPAARAVLKANWPDVQIANDIRTLKSLPPCRIITAGFPCQDLSQAGQKAGIDGTNSGLVAELFRLLKNLTFEPDWVVIENVPYMLSLARGHAMGIVITSLEKLGFRWAYRVVDARAFGLPQRRPRVILLASRRKDPRLPLADDVPVAPIDEKPAIIRPGSAYGFYWTEGSRGLGWVRDAVPPIKGGSALGIPSPPAIWAPGSGLLGKPTIEDAERLQGFPAGWTAPASLGGSARVGARWKLVGNAVNVAMANWLGQQLIAEQSALPPEMLIAENAPWPWSAYGGSGVRNRLLLSSWPERRPMTRVTEFLNDDLVPLSEKAAAGFLRRALSTPKLVYSPKFLSWIERYCAAHYGGDARRPLKRVG
jgi:DNA (cytosine-5)-methyltransferase 1